MLENLVFAVKDEILHMKGADPVSIILKGLPDHPGLGFGCCLIGMDQIHAV